MDSVSDPDLDEWDERIAKVLAKVLAKGLPKSKHAGVHLARVLQQVAGPSDRPERASA